ncbi:uncharacterized protein [Lolium perenne]|uniref:uncharacterized protein isoform X1 n=1 Tax=Lolium perenne TaxID=4522 RepID=UPI003A9A58DE
MTGKYFSGKQYQWRRSQQLTCSSVEEGHEDQGRDLLHTITPDLVFIIDDKSHKVFTRVDLLFQVLPDWLNSSSRVVGRLLCASPKGCQGSFVRRSIAFWVARPWRGGVAAVIQSGGRRCGAVPTA